ncbi:hypothetical protein BBO_02730 [Beauveria brongniartii RCEF 3172]|uniref:Uncharacterized protein n=1 Tax=Beauveria brongniartii RCEF 3172 TaxID=1081107 RepID=A0A167GYY9_9HYPO|nr:hypothetical protein BBO_02730 [Beauveria brongniartii RCEF 3172]
MPPKVIQISCGPEGSSAKYLLADNWGRVTKALQERAELSIMESPDDIGSTMKKINPSAVIVIEGGIDRLESRLIAEKSELKAFVQNGGIVLFCGLIASIISKAEFERIFGENGFNVGWTFGRYIGYHAGSDDKKVKGHYGNKVKGNLNRNAEVYINDSLNLQSAQLPDEIDPFRPLVVTVENPAHVLYSVVDPQVMTRAEYNGVGVMSPVGRGFVGFWGDRDNDVAQTVEVISAMLGLPCKKQQ